MSNNFYFWGKAMPRLILLVGALLVASHQAFGDFVFTETFDGYVEGTKASQNIKDTITAPVLWTDEAYTSIIPPEKASKLVGLEGIKAKTNPKIVTNSIARSATQSAGLLFTYKEGINTWSEQRFKLNQAVLGKKGLSEIWIQYDMFIPNNFRLLDAKPTSGNYFGGGHKVLALYADAYSAPNSTMIFGQLFARKDLKGLASYDGNAYQHGTLSTYKNGERIYTEIPIDESRKQAWIFAERDLGKWQRRTVHFKFPSSEASNDGVIEVWIQRADSSVHKLVDFKGGSFFGYEQNYFNAGYFNGWCNDGFDGQIYFFLDNVIITDNPANIDSAALVSGNPPLGPQNPRLQ